MKVIELKSDFIEVMSPKELKCRVPQRLPLSPLLFLLKMAEPKISGNATSRLSYIDDTGIIGFERIVTVSTPAAQRELDSLMN